MKRKTLLWVVITAAALLFLELLVLTALPCSFVRVLRTADPALFNSPPGEAMTVPLGGTSFSYLIPSRLKKGFPGEVAARAASLTGDEFARAVAVSQWVRERLTFGTADGGGGFPVEEILERSGKSGAAVLCDSYSRLFVLACQALGIPSRIVELEGHIVAEVFLRKNRRWAMIDPTYCYSLTAGGIILPVTGIIDRYRNSLSMTPLVFCKERGDDGLYGAEREESLKQIYLNGTTVISDQTIDRVSIEKSLLHSFRLPIAKMQYLNGTTELIGRREEWLRGLIMVTLSLLLIAVLIMVFIKRVRKRAIMP